MSRSASPRRLLYAATLTATLSLVPSSSAFAKTLYVAPSGSDANAGTVITAPLRSLNKAISVAVPGDKVLMRSGTYGALNTTTRVNKSGTASAPITYARYPGEAQARLAALRDRMVAAGPAIGALAGMLVGAFLIIDGAIGLR